MDKTPCLIMTSIADHENQIIKDYAKACADHKFGFIMAGDLKSPREFNLPGCEFLSVSVQKNLAFKIAKLVPDNSYSKKNIAYLHAIKKGYEVLVETDDDNKALPEFWEARSPFVKGNFLEDKNWVNIYRYFSDINIWPRGFSLHHIKEPLPALGTVSGEPSYCPIQQGLADENPDVDAIFRLSAELPVYFKKREPVVLGNKSVCPFNSQNTTWFKPAFPLLYLPSYCSFRMTDIWRSFVAQRILWENNWNLAFHQATVCQVRNEHNLLKNFEDEVPGYLNNETIMRDLMDLGLKSGEDKLGENLLACYKLLVDKKHVGAQELALVEAWIEDMASLMAS